MRKYFKDSEEIPSIFDAALAYENGNCGIIRPRTNVVVNTNRLWYGDKSTVSAFIATAYDQKGNKVDSMEGYFLEPVTNYELAKAEGKRKAIMSGQYNVIPKSEMLRKENEKRRKNGESEIKNLKYDWYIDNPPGRSFVAIHVGNDWEDTTGCFLPGEICSFDSITNTYNVSKSTKKTKELFDFFDNYGRNGIKINVGPDFKELY